MKPAASDAWLAAACGVLASPVRRAILRRLFQVEPVGIDMRGLAVSLDLAPHAALTHLQTLADAGLACAVTVRTVTVYRPCVGATSTLFGAILGAPLASVPSCVTEATRCDVYVAP